MSDKIDWRTLKVGEHVTVTFDAVVSVADFAHAKFAIVDDGTTTHMAARELGKATITKKEQPLKVGDTVDVKSGNGRSPGKILAVDDDQAWVKWTDGSRGQWPVERLQCL